VPYSWPEGRLLERRERLLGRRERPHLLLSRCGTHAPHGSTGSYIAAGHRGWCRAESPASRRSGVGVGSISRPTKGSLSLGLCYSRHTPVLIVPTCRQCFPETRRKKHNGNIISWMSRCDQDGGGVHLGTLQAQGYHGYTGRQSYTNSTQVVALLHIEPVA
jgi:hypothetical protein